MRKRNQGNLKGFGPNMTLESSRSKGKIRVVSLKEKLQEEPRRKDQALSF